MVHVTIKKDLNIYSVNPLYIIFGKVNRYFEEINEIKYLMLVPTNESKKKTKKYGGIEVYRAVFHENNKYCPCLYKIFKCYIVIELTFLKELMLMKQVH